MSNILHFLICTYIQEAEVFLGVTAYEYYHNENIRQHIQNNLQSIISRNFFSELYIQSYYTYNQTENGNHMNYNENINHNNHKNYGGNNSENKFSLISNMEITRLKRLGLVDTMLSEIGLN